MANKVYTRFCTVVTEEIEGIPTKTVRYQDNVLRIEKTSTQFIDIYVGYQEVFTGKLDFTTRFNDGWWVYYLAELYIQALKAQIKTSIKNFKQHRIEEKRRKQEYFGSFIDPRKGKKNE